MAWTAVDGQHRGPPKTAVHRSARAQKPHTTFAGKTLAIVRFVVPTVAFQQEFLTESERPANPCP
ncbi:MAG TPA: hypothetical protein VKC63_12590, partial [Solirubrobacterales bacterium]|nr:hypothetical protein [Solirubrobacterales bacterium]